MEHVLRKTVPGKLFIGLTYGEFVDRIIDYFLPKFNRPIKFVADDIREQTVYFGSMDMENLISVFESKKGRFSIEIRDKGRVFNTVLPQEVMGYLIEMLKTESSTP